MDLIDRLRELAARIPKQLDYVQTEEATKSALVMPFIAALGYDVFNPLEVTPELNADVGMKKGEKVDYAIMRDGQPIILIECKHHTGTLSLENASQLYRYFGVTAARFAILTNGMIYRFYTDLDAANKMDSKPFFEFNILEVDERIVEELKKFSKSAFDIDTILTTAAELRYTREIKSLVAQQFQEPSPEFMRFFVTQVYGGRLTQAARDQFEVITRRALRQFIADQVNERLKSALGNEVGIPASPAGAVAAAAAPPVEAPAEGKPEAETTEEEHEAFLVIRAILREVVDVRRVTMRDRQSYCGLLLDDNNRKPLARLYFNRQQKYLGLFGEGRVEEKVPIESLDDIYTYDERLRTTVGFYQK